MPVRTHLSTEQTNKTNKDLVKVCNIYSKLSKLSATGKQCHTIIVCKKKKKIEKFPVSGYRWELKAVHNPLLTNYYEVEC